MRKQKRLRVYTVVRVWRGIADGARSFANLAEARRYMRQARRWDDRPEDDVELFEGTVSLPARSQQPPHRS